MQGPNRIINPNTRFTMQIIIEYDPHTGDTQLQMRNHSGVQVTMLQAASLLAEHTATLMRAVVSGTVKTEPVKEEPSAPTPEKAN